MNELEKKYEELIAHYKIKPIDREKDYYMSGFPKKGLEWQNQCNQLVSEIAALKQGEPVSDENNRIIDGCYDCPMCDENDMSTGYSCRLLSSPDGYIKENKKFQPITPKWCPIKKPLTIQLNNKI